MNNLEFITHNWKRSLSLLVLLLGLILAMYLVQKQQIFKSKANTEIDAAIEVKSEDGTVTYQGNDTFKTTSKNIQVNIKSLQGLDELNR